MLAPGALAPVPAVAAGSFPQGALALHAGGVDQRPADLLEGFGDVDFGDAAFALDQLEGPFEFIG